MAEKTVAGVLNRTPSPPPPFLREVMKLTKVYFVVLDWATYHCLLSTQVNPVFFKNASTLDTPSTFPRITNVPFL